MLAELALGLAGFTGVAAAFGGRDRTYTTAERIRLLSIFFSAGSALVGSLCVLAFASAGGSAATAYLFASMLVASLHLVNLRFIPEAYRLAIDPNASTSMTTLALFIGVLLVTVGLLAANFIVREAWLLISVISIQLAWGLFLFARILTHRN